MSEESKQEAQAEEFSEESRRFYNAIEILSKTPEWPVFVEWVKKQMALRVKHNSAPIMDNSELQVHNYKAGEVNGMHYVVTIPNTISSLREMDRLAKDLEKLNDLENERLSKPI